MSVAMPTEAPLSLADILSFKHGIKRPQLVGIIAGCAVFLVTIVTVFILLWKSGTLHKFAKEMQEESGNRKKKGVEEDDRAEDVDVLQQLAARPQLHDHLVCASKTLPMKPNINGKELAGTICLLREYNDASDLDNLITISDGSPIFGESAYSPSKLFYWIVNGLIITDDTTFEWPSASKEQFRDYLSMKDTVNDNSRHLVVVDKVLKSLVGMISVVDNSPGNLSARLDNIWLTPAFQNKLYGYDLMLTTLTWLFELGYRRVTIELDSRHILGKKYVERCGFILETTLRKHMIVHNGRNRDTCLYVMLNSDWIESEIKLKKRVGIDPLKTPALKVAEIAK